MNTSTVALAGIGGLAAAELSGVTNFIGGGDNTQELADLLDQLPDNPGLNLGGIDVDVPESGTARVAEIVAEASDQEIPSGEQLRDQFTAGAWDPSDVEVPGTGGGNGGGGGGGKGFLDRLGDAGEASRSFTSDNKFVAAGATLGASPLGPVGLVAGTAAGGVAEIVSDSVTGANTLGYRSPVDITTGSGLGGGPGETAVDAVTDYTTDPIGDWANERYEWQRGHEDPTAQSGVQASTERSQAETGALLRSVTGGSADTTTPTDTVSEGVSTAVDRLNNANREDEENTSASATGRARLVR